MAAIKKPAYSFQSVPKLLVCAWSFLIHPWSGWQTFISLLTEEEKFRDEAEGKTRIPQNEVRSREETERLIANLNRKVVVLDNKVEAAEEKLSLIDNKLDNSVHASEES